MTMEEQVPEPDGGARSAQDQGLLELAAGVVVDPAPTLRAITRDAPVGLAILVTVALSLLSSAASAAQARFGELEGPLANLGLSLPALIAGMLLLGPLFSLLGLTVGTGILKLSSLALKGKGPYRNLFTGLAFANVPSVFGIPVQLLVLAIGPAGRIVSGLVSFGLGIWIVFLTVIAVRETNRFTTGRAVAAVLIPIAIVIVLGILLLMLFAAAAFGTHGAVA